MEKRVLKIWTETAAILGQEPRDLSDETLISACVLEAEGHRRDNVVQSVRRARGKFPDGVVPKRARKSKRAKNTGFDFETPPPVGYEMDYYGMPKNACCRPGRSVRYRLVLVAVRPLAPGPDGAPRFSLVWETKGEPKRRGTTGLRGTLIRWDDTKPPPVVDFEAPPSVGYEAVLHGVPVRLVEVRPYTRKSDGGASFVLTWETKTAPKRRGTTGLRSKGVCWEKP